MESLSALRFTLHEIRFTLSRVTRYGRWGDLETNCHESCGLSKENQWQQADQETGCTIISIRSFLRSVTATWAIPFSRLLAAALRPRL